MSFRAWTLSMYVLSTCHISLETKEHFDHGIAVPGVAEVAEYSHGYFVLFDVTDDTLVDPDLLAVRTLLEGIDHVTDTNDDYIWVRLDSDGDVIHGLPIHDW